ncbi:MAG: F0F1 ATP synthase subunit A [Anaerolineae bacterium]|nr:F0F1 ATP synthase subunit A [Anaerolineae bacterium]
MTQMTEVTEQPQKKWRWGVNRWWVLLFIILTTVGVNYIAAPVRPHIQVAPERLLEEPLFTLPVIGDLYLVNTLTSLLLVDLVIILIALIVRNSLRDGNLAPKGVAGAMAALVEILYNLTETSAGKWAKQIFPWFASIVLLVVVANLIKLLPGFETIGFLHHFEHGQEVQALGGNWYNILPTEAAAGGYIVTSFLRGPSTDLNFTLALALISVGMTQVIGLRAQGLRYFSKFLNFTTIFKKPFFGFMDFIVGLLEAISELAKILSFSFRLFGVMFSGIVLVALVGSLLPVFMPSLIYAFELFMGLIQAFVFGMLTMVFMAQATQGHGLEDHGDH